MRITESQLRRIVRQEILRESAMPTDELDKQLKQAIQALSGGGTSSGGMLGGMVPSAEILGVKPDGTLIKFSISGPVLGQISQHFLISQDRGMLMVMPATEDGKIDQAMMQKLKLPSEGFRDVGAMIGWLMINLPMALSGMGGILSGMGGGGLPQIPNIFGR